MTPVKHGPKGMPATVPARHEGIWDPLIEESHPADVDPISLRKRLAAHYVTATPVDLLDGVMAAVLNADMVEVKVSPMSETKGIVRACYYLLDYEKTTGGSPVIVARVRARISWDYERSPAIWVEHAWVEKP